MRALSITAILALVVAAGPAGAQPDRTSCDTNILSVSGTGEVRVVPNRAMVTLGVETRAARAAEAIQENNRIMTQVVQAIRNQNVPERNIQTATYNVSRQFEPEPTTDQRQPQRQVYVVTNLVSVRLEDVTRVGAVIDAGTSAGANQVHGISFLSEKETEARQEALRAAVADARQKADNIAQALNMRIVGVESVMESGGPIVYSQRMEVAAAAPDQAPVFPGENVMRTSVTVRFRLGAR